MKKEVKTTYICEFCGNTNEDESVISSCENTHLKMDELEIVKLGHKDKNVMFPEKIFVASARDKHVMTYEKRYPEKKGKGK